MITTPKLLGLLAVAFVSGSFVASPELRAYAANTIGSADIINNSIQSVDIKDGEVKAADIATDAVGASELQGVTKLLFGQCVLDSEEGTSDIQPGTARLVRCNISGVDSDDSAIATLNKLIGCLDATAASTLSNQVVVLIGNYCDHSIKAGTGTRVSIMVYDK